MLQDLVMTAVNEAIARSKEFERERMSRYRRRHGPPRHAGPAGARLGAMTGLIAPVARLIEEFNKLPGFGRRRPSGSRTTCCAPRPTTRAPWPRRSSRSRRRSPLLRSAATSPRRGVDPCGSAPIPAGRDASAWSRSRSTCWPSSAPASSAAAITCCTARSAPSTASGPSGFAARELLARAAPGGIGGGDARQQPEPRGRGDGDVPRGAARAARPEVTRLARGLPVGGDLEYADDVTLIRSLPGRRLASTEGASSTLRASWPTIRLRAGSQPADAPRTASEGGAAGHREIAHRSAR